MDSNKITLEQYLSIIGDNGQFVVPNYQRGYVWGKYSPEYEDDSATHMIKSLVDAFSKKKSRYFLQGITVWKNGSNIVLVDGQQRTTFFYLLLKSLDYQKHLKIHYDIREDSNKFLQEFGREPINSIIETGDEKFQDIYFFKKSLRVIRNEIKDIDKKEFLDYILSHVEFLYIPIDKDKAEIIFSMMNGNKAKMLQEELIKSELLRSASLKSELTPISEPENISIRSRLAREWDQWLYWWNDDEHQKFFRSEQYNMRTPTGWLLPLINNDRHVTLENFCKKHLEQSTVQKAKLVCKEMRLIQKRIEDAYNDPKIYNYIGAIIRFHGVNDSYAFMKWYVDYAKDHTKEELYSALERHYDLSMIGLLHKDIISEDREDITSPDHEDGNLSSPSISDKNIMNKIESFKELLSSDDLYRKHYEVAAKWLLRVNIDLDNNSLKEPRKFIFSIWDNRSLEHIYPKSKVYHIDEDGNILNWEDKPWGNATEGYLNRADIHITEDGQEYKASEHSIGNLVLLYGKDNSEFGAKEFEDKKQQFFGNVEENIFYSRHLIHTMGTFANTKWNVKEIVEHKQVELANYDKQYEKYSK